MVNLKKAIPKLAFVLILMVVVLITSGCLAERSVVPEQPAGFFTGVWHGWLAPLSLILGFFNHQTVMYQVHNTGWWYDFGFYCAVISGFGSISLTRHSRKSSKRKDD